MKIRSLVVACAVLVGALGVVAAPAEARPLRPHGYHHHHHHRPPHHLRRGFHHRRHPGIVGRVVRGVARGL